MRDSGHLLKKMDPNSAFHDTIGLLNILALWPVCARVAEPVWE
jgi:hypothetical protein